MKLTMEGNRNNLQGFKNFFMSKCLCPSILIDITLLVNRRTYTVTPTAASTGGGSSSITFLC